MKLLKVHEKQIYHVYAILKMWHIYVPSLCTEYTDTENKCFHCING